MGITTRKGRPYAKSKVQKMLSNPFYIGINRHNGRDYPGAQEKLIKKELFDAVQKKLHRGRPIVLKRHNPIFKNMIHCEGCGGVVTWQKQKAHYYGTCQRSSEACKGRKLLREDRIEAMVTEMRGETKKTNLENKIRSSWLGLRFRNITFTQEEDIDVKEIRNLLNESADQS